MARIRYRRIPEASLIDLSDEELRVLDLALADYRHKLFKDAKVDDHHRRVVADSLHDQILLIKQGEYLDEAAV